MSSPRGRTWFLAWRRYWALGRRERRLLWEAWWVLVRARTRLSRGAFQAARAWSESEPWGRRADGATPADLGRAVQRAARAVPGALCLAQALAARVLLRRRGIEAELCLGAGRRDQGGFVAHAWLEAEGRLVYGDPQPDRFGRFEQLPPGAGSRAERPES